MLIECQDESLLLLCDFEDDFIMGSPQTNIRSVNDMPIRLEAGEKRLRFARHVLVKEHSHISG